MQDVLDLITARSIRSAIVIRHAERFPIHDVEGHWTTPITEKGMADAEALGRLLCGSFESFRFMHSPVVRCKQTAEAMARVQESADRKVAGIIPMEMLGLSYMKVPISEGFAEADRFGRGFLREWFDGRISAELYKPLAESRDEHVAYLRETLSDAPAGSHLDVHVTHDWNVNVLREGIFGLKHENEGWPDFLDGLGFSLEVDQLNVVTLNGGHRRTI